MLENTQNDQEVPAYSEANLAEICAALRVAKLSDEQRKKLERARLVYILIRGTDPNTKDDPNPISVRPTRSQHRKALKRVADSARALASAPAHLKDTHRGRLERALTSHNLLLTELMSRRGEFDLTNDEDVVKLAELAETERARNPPKGPEPKLARLHFIGELVSIFHDVTHSSPGRRVRQVSLGYGDTSEEYGPFRDFVCAALEPLNPNALRGVDKDIKRAITELKGQTDSPDD